MTWYIMGWVTVVESYFHQEFVFLQNMYATFVYGLRTDKYAKGKKEKRFMT